MTIFDFSILVRAFLLSVIESKKLNPLGTRLVFFILLNKLPVPQNFICAMLKKQKNLFDYYRVFLFMSLYSRELIFTI